MADTTPVDLDAIEAKWLHVCGRCDAGLNYACTCPAGDPRAVIQQLVDALRSSRATDTEWCVCGHAKSAHGKWLQGQYDCCDCHTYQPSAVNRATDTGKDDRIRELEAELATVRNTAEVLAHVISQNSALTEEAAAMLDGSAGYLLDPGKVAVDRELLERYMRATSLDWRWRLVREYRDAEDRLRAALSQGQQP